MRPRQVLIDPRPPTQLPAAILHGAPLTALPRPERAGLLPQLARFARVPFFRVLKCLPYLVSSLTGELKRELCGDLRDARRRSVGDISKRGATNVSIHRAATKKLSMVEGIERFETDLQSPRFCKLGDLVDRQAVVVHTRSVERAARRVARRAQSIRGE